MENERFIIDKNKIEQILGFEINDFKLEPLFEEDVCIGLKVFVKPYVSIEEISISLDFSQYKNIKTKEDYYSLLNSGMFWEFHPELSGDWEKDKLVINY